MKKTRPQKRLRRPIQCLAVAGCVCLLLFFNKFPSVNPFVFSLIAKSGACHRHPHRRPSAPFARLLGGCVDSPPSWLAIVTRRSLSASDAEGATSSTPSCVVGRLGLASNFERWRFLQKLLDAEVDAADVNQLLYRVLKSFLDHPRLSCDKDDESITGSPKITPEKRATIEGLFRHDEAGRGVIWALREPECSPGRLDALEGLDSLLPDPIEDEDSHKGSWDMVIELHGRESVRIREEEGADGLVARCRVARLLIHYDFLSNGVVEEPFS